MTNYLLIVTIVIFACVFLSRVSNRLGIPTLLFFILLGMVFGSDGILKIPFDNYAFAYLNIPIQKYQKKQPKQFF